MAVDFETKLVARMAKLAEQHPRWGYRMVHGLLVEEGLQVSPQWLKASGQKAIGEAASSAWMLPALRPNLVWPTTAGSLSPTPSGADTVLEWLAEQKA